MEESTLDPAAFGTDPEELFVNGLSLLREAQSVAIQRIALEKETGQVPLKGLISAQKDLGALLDLAVKMEQKINDRHGHHTGNEISGDVDVDLDDARYEIGCRLDRLRACCYSN